MKSEKLRSVLGNCVLAAEELTEVGLEAPVAEATAKGRCDSSAKWVSVCEVGSLKCEMESDLIVKCRLKNIKGGLKLNMET